MASAEVQLNDVERIVKSMEQCHGSNPAAWPLNSIGEWMNYTTFIAELKGQIQCQPD